MLVEDDAPTRAALARIFTLRGWAVDAAATVVEALEFLNLGPRCVVLDLMLPYGDGLAVLKAIRDAGLPIRVAVTTGSNDRERLVAVRGLAPEFVLFKPIDVRDLDPLLDDRPTTDA